MLCLRLRRDEDSQGAGLLMAVGTSDVSRRPQASGLGEHVVTVQCPGTLWAKVLPCPTVSSCPLLL